MHKIRYSVRDRDGTEGEKEREGWTKREGGAQNSCPTYDDKKVTRIFQ